MTMKSTFARSIAAASVLLAMSAPALAGKTGEVTLGADAEYFMLDSDLDLENGMGYRLNGGYRFSENWGVRASYARINSEVHDSVFGVGGNDADVDSYRVEAQYFMNTDSNTQPYLSFGVQKHNDVEVDNGRSGPDVGRDINEQLTIGGGVRHYFNPHFSLNAGVNLSQDDGHNSDASIGVGFAVHFGGSDEAAPASEPAPVAPAACADSDADGVCDTVDQCPGTPAGVSVDANGCPATMIKEDVTIEMKVLFDTDKSVVKDEYLSEVEKVAAFLKEHANTDATIEGHTDSTASDAYNQGLSERRADAVRELLVSKYGIDAARLKAAGYGEARPVADNGTVEGRAQNRRVISVIVTQVEKAK